MIREISSRQACHSPKGSFTSRRLPLLALLAATSIATMLACSSDDNKNEPEQAVAPLDGVPPLTVPERALPPIPAAPPAAAPGSDTPNGLSLPDGILDWRVIGVVNIPDNPAMEGNQGTLRVIVGNSTAVTAARAGQTNPWPEGSMMGHFQWVAGTNPDFAAMVAPGAFARITLMEKDSTRFAADGNWAYGRWDGATLVPPAAGFDRACVNCHTATVASNDMVFTIPGPLPSQATIDAAPTLSNDLTLPQDILDWRVIGASSRETDMTPTIRVIVGNDIAVTAARAGQTNPWPDGAMLAHYVWNIGDNNPNSPDSVNAAAFNGFTLMVKNAGDYAADGGWAYGVWSTPQLTPPAAAGFDQACVACHTTSVGPDNDFVFTRPGVLPTDMFPEAPQAL
jgi:Cytochrome P460